MRTHDTLKRTSQIAIFHLCLVLAASAASLPDQLTQFSQNRLASKPTDQLGRDMLSLVLATTPPPRALLLRDALMTEKEFSAGLDFDLSNSALAERVAIKGEKLISNRRTRTLGLLYLAASKRLDPLQEKSHLLLTKAKQHKLETDFTKLLLTVNGKDPLETAEKKIAPSSPIKAKALDLTLVKFPYKTYSYRPRSPAAYLNAMQKAGAVYKYKVAVGSKSGLPVVNTAPEGSPAVYSDAEPLPAPNPDAPRGYLGGTLESVVHQFCGRNRVNFRIKGNLITFTAIGDPEAVADHGFMLTPEQLNAEFARNPAKATMLFRGNSILTQGKVTNIKMLAGGKASITINDAIQLQLNRTFSEDAEKIRLALMEIKKLQNKKNYDMDEYYSSLKWKSAMKSHVAVAFRAQCKGGSMGSVVLVEPEPFQWKYSKP